MAISIDFKNAVSEGKMRLVRIILKDSLIIDPTFSEFNEMYNYAKGNMEDLLEDFDDGELDNDKNNWSEDYMNGLKVELMGNFSRKRIDHLKQICSYLYKDKVKVKAIGPQRGKTSPPPVGDTKKSVAKGVIVSGVAIGVVGVIVAETTIGVIGAVITGTTIAVAGIVLGSKK